MKLHLLQTPESFLFSTCKFRRSLIYSFTVVARGYWCILQTTSTRICTFWMLKGGLRWANPPRGALLQDVTNFSNACCSSADMPSTILQNLLMPELLLLYPWLYTVCFWRSAMSMVLLSPPARSWFISWVLKSLSQAAGITCKYSWKTSTSSETSPQTNW